MKSRKSFKSFLLRIDPELYSELERWAAQELRSVNGQIEYLLKEAVRQRKGNGRPGGRNDTRQDGSS
jgi:hypothetical protein